MVRHGPIPKSESLAETSSDGFSTNLESGPFHFGRPEDYARAKANQFPEEGGPVILAVDIPDEVIELAVNDWFPLSQGLVQFDPSAGLEDLMAVWSSLAMEIRSVQ